jgi:hypothetical protein
VGPESLHTVLITGCHDVDAQKGICELVEGTANHEELVLSTSGCKIEGERAKI